jgi:hypothetical protein
LYDVPFAARMDIMKSLIYGFTIALCCAAAAAAPTGLPASAAPSTAAGASVDAWINSQAVVRCFPELYSDRLLFKPPFNRLRRDIPWTMRVPPSLQKHVIKQGNVVKLYAGYDDLTKTALVMHDSPGGVDQVLVAGATVPPAAVSRGPIQMSLNDEITLGTRREHLENYFSTYLLHAGELVREHRCGLVAERYATDYVGHIFVFEADTLVAYFTVAAA